MPTVIDALTVTIGLDSKKFLEEQKHATAALKKSKEDMKKFGDEFEENAKRSLNSFSKIRSEVVGLLGAAAGAYGVKQFVSNLVTSDAAVGRFARTTGMAVEEVAKFEKAIELAGGGEGAGRSALSGLNDQVQAFRAGLGGNILPIYNQMALEGGKVIDINAKVIDQFIAIARNARAIEAKTPGRGGFFLRQLGINEDAINILIRGDAYMRDILEKSEKLGAAVKKDTDAAEEFLGKWRTLGQLLTGIFRPLEAVVAEGFLDPLNATLDKISKNQKVMEDLKPSDKPKLGKERLDNLFGAGLPASFNRFLDWFGPDDILINSIFGKPQDRLLSKYSGAGAGAGAGSERTKSVPYFGGAFGGLNFKPLNWETGGSGGTEINVTGPITINAPEATGSAIRESLQSGIESLAQKRRNAIQFNSGQE